MQPQDQKRAGMAGAGVSLGIGVGIALGAGIGLALGAGLCGAFAAAFAANGKSGRGE